MAGRVRTGMVAAAVFGLVLAACGGGSSNKQSATTVAAATTAAATTTTAASTTTTTAAKTTTTAPAPTSTTVDVKAQDTAKALLLTADDLGGGWTSAPSSNANDGTSAADQCVQQGAGKIEPVAKATSDDFTKEPLTVSSDASVYANAAIVKAQQAVYTADSTVSCLDAALKKMLTDAVAGSGGTLGKYSLRRIDYPAVRGSGFAFEIDTEVVASGQTVPLQFVLVGDSLGRNTVSVTAFATGGTVPPDLIDQLVTKLQAKLKQQAS